MSDAMTEVYRRKNSIEKFEDAFLDLYREAPSDWLEIVMENVSKKLVISFKLSSSL